ncbi:ligase-associated DNA damage response endonuclease PdeM [Chryseobacterium potabilaquae]|uniref:Calcineurin-like phosphoesterase domain-containing protein n=1 Tax=Chryseobacterium potabilaquae TaxID=2675057 RepID=A0A6N4XC70_9FLAO|nr:ligase-associated DNA damage response endonuclease PdeM [Chryseobacterium potabilaquae]CAA7196096.1 hypothetical protein CHRY9293_02228 [Chryseobacterium potabilaquae]
MVNIVTKDINIKNEIFTLTNQRAVFWKSEEALILSDLHIGKTAHFRKNGIALSHKIMERDLDRLSALIDHFHPEKMIVVGDLLHAGNNSDVEKFCNWRSHYPKLELYLIEGNHDRISTSLEKKLCLNNKTNQLNLHDFIFTHDFDNTQSHFQITGHIHPGVILNSTVSNIRMPCFVLTSNQLLLPAFSEFTGLDTKNTPKSGKFFMFTHSEIYEIG